MMDVRTDWDTKAGGDWSTQEEEALLSRLSIYTSVSTVSSRSEVIPGVIRENCAVLCVSRHMTYF